MGATADGESRHTVAVHSVDVDVGGVGLWREAVVANVDPDLLDAEVDDVEGVEEVGVLGQGRGVVGLGRHDDVLERHALRGDDKVGPARRVLLVDALHGKVGRVLGVEEDRPQVVVVRVEDFEPCELVPPSLAISVEHAVAIDLDVLAAPLPEHDRVLERVRERVGLPVRRVVGEPDLAVPLDLHVVQEGQIERLSDQVQLVLLELQGAAVVSLLEAGVEIISDIVRVVARRPDGDDVTVAAATSWGRRVGVLLSKLIYIPRDISRQVAKGGESAGGRRQRDE